MEQHQYTSIDIRQARVGLFVTLDLPWMEHPFLTSSFKIKNEEQLNLLRRLGLSTVRYDPQRSDAKPLEPTDAPPPAAAQPAGISADEKAIIRAKHERMQRLTEHRSAVAECERHLYSAASTIKTINRDLFSKPQETMRASVDLVKHMLDAMLVDREIVLHSLNDKIGGEEVYYHSLNVSVLSMMVAKELKLSREAAYTLGLGTVFHDIGKANMPDRILRKLEPLTASERNYLALHPGYGVEMGQKLMMPKPVLDIILHHHEFMDGSGYPDGLKGEQIDKLTRIACVVNHFDNLCNPVNPDRALTPYEAISTMFAKQRTKFDPVVLSTFIKYMGIYPPGTVVRLTNDLWGMVVSVNTARPTFPHVLVYDPEVPKTEAIIVNTEDDPDLTIKHTYRPNQIPGDVYEYLSPKRRVTYYFSEAQPSQTSKPA